MSERDLKKFYLEMGKTLGLKLKGPVDLPSMYLMLGLISGKKPKLPKRPANVRP